MLRWRGPTADATDVKRAVYIEDLPPHVVSIKGVGRPFSRTWDKSNSLARSRRAGQGEVSIAERTRAELTSLFRLNDRARFSNSP